MRHPPETLYRSNAKSRTHARARGEDRAQAHPGGGVADQATTAGTILGAIQRVRDLLNDYLDAWPSSRVAHHAGTLAYLENALNAAVYKDAERERRRIENARDRVRRNWQPHEIRAAEKMGFEDPADWRRYIDEREAAPHGAFPTPEEWRRDRED